MSHGRRVGPGIYRMPNGRYFVRLCTGPRGARHQIYRQFDHKMDAEEFARAYKLARIYRSAGLPTVDPAEAPRSLRWLWSQYEHELRALDRSASHIRNLYKAQKLSEAALGPERLVPLTRDDLVQLASYARSHTKTAGDAIVRTYRLLHAAHKRADLDMASPPDIIVERKGRRILSPAQFRAFLEELPDGSCERLAVILAYVTGCRESELIALLRSDVDLEAGLVTIRSRKTGGPPRVIPIGQRIVEMVRAFRPGDPETAPLLTLDGAPLRETSLRKRLQAASRAAKIPTVHTLGWVRNQAATAAVEAGEGLDVASRALGHADPSVTRRHYDRAEMTSARKTFSDGREGEILGPADGPAASSAGPAAGPSGGENHSSTASQNAPKTPVLPSREKKKKAS